MVYGNIYNSVNNTNKEKRKKTKRNKQKIKPLSRITTVQLKNRYGPCHSLKK